MIRGLQSQEEREGFAERRWQTIKGLHWQSGEAQWYSLGRGARGKQEEARGDLPGGWGGQCWSLSS